MSRSLPTFLIATWILSLDQWTKWLALSRLAWNQSIEIIPGFFSLTLVKNSGAAWGILKSYGFLLTILALVALIVLIISRRHFTYRGLLPGVSLGLLLGGIAGNLADRLNHEYVVDFLNFYIGRYHWPAFNVADSAICIGVGLYMIDSFRQEKQPAKTSSEPA